MCNVSWKKGGNCHEQLVANGCIGLVLGLGTRKLKNGFLDNAFHASKLIKFLPLTQELAEGYKRDFLGDRC